MKTIFIAIIIVISWASLESFASELGTQSSQCAEIGYMPASLFLTYGKDSQDNLVDIHTYSKYFTFQIDRPIKQNEKQI